MRLENNVLEISLSWTHNQGCKRQVCLWIVGDNEQDP